MGYFRYGVLALAVLLASAQEFRSTISGRVIDASGAAVPGARLAAVNVATNESTNATTDATGA